MKILNQKQSSSLQAFKERNAYDMKPILGEAQLAKRKPVEILPIERGELEKIKKLLDKAKPVSSFCQNAFWLCVGLVAPAIFSLMSISPTDTREWLKVLGWTMPFLFLILSAAFWLMSGKEKNALATSVEQIKEEIQFIEGKFLSGESSKR